MSVRLVGFSIAAMAIPVAAYGLAQEATPHSSAASNISPEAKAYLDRAITAFREMHINASKMDWPSLTKQAYAAAIGANTTADTYPAIRLIIKALGEKHTFLVDPDHAKATMTGNAAGNVAPPPLTLPEVERLPNGMGLVRLHTFAGSYQQAQLYANTGEAKIKELQRAGVCKFVLDLSSDKGGNMYPMLQAVSGFLKEGVLGTFESARGQFMPWVLKAGTVTVATPTNSPPVLTSDGQVSSPVAVILGSSTASAGEFTAMSFKGRPSTRFFGAPTAGYVTANQPIFLADGAVIAMTSGWGIDRTGKKYVDPIQPDVPTAAGAETLTAALKWLSKERCARHTRSKT